MPVPGDSRLGHLRRLSWWLDEGIRIPGTRFRIGLDPILGLIPGLGDAAGALMSAAVVVEAIRRNVPRLTLVRMAANILLDAAAGSVPLLGDAFDAAWKANSRNLRLLERHAKVSTEARREDRLFVGGLFGLIFLFCAGLVLAFALLAGSVLKWLGVI